MGSFETRASIKDGPWAGLTLDVETCPGGRPPGQVVIADPTGGRGIPGSTTYHPLGLDEARNAYVYSTGRSIWSVSADHPADCAALRALRDNIWITARPA
jgi:hypothetical protein